MKYIRCGTLIAFVLAAALGAGCQSSADANRSPPNALDTAPPGPALASPSGVGTSGSGAGPESVGPGSSPKPDAPSEPDLSGTGK